MSDNFQRDADATIRDAVAREQEREGSGVVLLLRWLATKVESDEIWADEKVRRVLGLPLDAGGEQG